MTFMLPFPLNKVTNEFNSRSAQMIKIGMGAHRGTDWTVPAGTEIPAVGDGVVKYVGVSRVLGNVIVQSVTTAEGKTFYIGYCHLQKAPTHKVGDSVSCGDTIGLVGATGTAAPTAHLHATLANTVKGVFDGAHNKVIFDLKKFLVKQIALQDGDKVVTKKKNKVAAVAVKPTSEPKVASSVDGDHSEPASEEEAVKAAEEVAKLPEKAFQAPPPRYRQALDGVEGKDYLVRSRVGFRIHPITKAKKFHNGTDIGSPHEPCWIYAPADGTVVQARESKAAGGGFGWYVKLHHVIDGRNYTTLYAHMVPNSLEVKDGQKVKMGTRLGKMGTSGFSTGKHLHWEVQQDSTEHIWNGTGKNYLEPVEFFNALIARDKAEGFGPLPSNPAELQPTPNNDVDGDNLSKEDWKQWQQILKDSHGYTGAIDGVPGKMTWSAVQRSAQPFQYTGAVDGIPGPLTRKAVQRRLANRCGYEGRIDGIWGSGTIKALQESFDKKNY